MVCLLGGDGMVANFHPPKRGPLCPCHFCVSTCGDLSAIRPTHRIHFRRWEAVTSSQRRTDRLLACNPSLRLSIPLSHCLLRTFWLPIAITGEILRVNQQEGGHRGPALRREWAHERRME